jgi:hypothetical protein
MFEGLNPTASGNEGVNGKKAKKQSKNNVNGQHW